MTKFDPIAAIARTPGLAPAFVAGMTEAAAVRALGRDLAEFPGFTPAQVLAGLVTPACGKTEEPR